MIWREVYFIPLKIDKTACLWYNIVLNYADESLAIRILFLLSDDSSSAFYFVIQTIELRNEL